MRIFSSKRRVAFASLVAIAGMALVPVVHAAVQFGPDRPTFTWSNPADHITFNSITNNPDSSVGDERTFVSARDAASSDKLTYSKSLTVKDNEEVIVRAFYHNDAASNLNLVATNTKVKVLLPTGSSTAPQVAAYISADNATPSMVWSTMDFSAGGQPFTMEYEPGTAQLWNQKQVGTKLNDSVASTGALIGFDQIDGKIPGCSEFSGVITIKARVHVTPPAVQPVFSCDLLHVTSQGDRAFKYSVDATAKSGATITGYTFDFGDGNSVNTTVNNTTHTYAKDGTYTSTATVKFNVGDSQKTASCSQTVTVTTPTTPTTPAPTKASTLPNTGAGDVLGIFTGASSLGAVGHYVVSRRKRGL